MMKKDKLRSCADSPYYTNEQIGPFCYEIVISLGSDEQEQADI